MKRLILILTAALAIMGNAMAQVKFQKPEIPAGSTSIYIANDLGRNGYFEQKTVAELMGWMADVVDPEFVAAIGDVHHFEGVASVDDPL